MNTHDLHADKLDLIGWIYSLKDSRLINELKKIKSKDNVTNDIPEWQKKIVRNRIETTKQEDYLSWEEIEKQLDLNK